MKRLLVAFLLSSVPAFSAIYANPEVSLFEAIRNAKASNLSRFNYEFDWAAIAAAKGPYNNSKAILDLLRGIDEKLVRFDVVSVRPSETGYIKMVSPQVLNFEFRMERTEDGSRFYKIVAVQP